MEVGGATLWLNASPWLPRPASPNEFILHNLPRRFQLMMKLLHLERHGHKLNTPVTQRFQMWTEEHAMNQNYLRVWAWARLNNAE